MHSAKSIEHRAWGSGKYITQGEGDMAGFRFEDLEIWKKGIFIANKLCDIADSLEQRKQFRFAEQLRGASLSVSNNIAEGSGSCSDKDFAHFLNIAKRSCFENANMLIFFTGRGIIATQSCETLLNELLIESRMIENFRKSLLKGL